MGRFIFKYLIISKLVHLLDFRSVPQDVTNSVHVGLVSVVCQWQNCVVFTMSHWKKVPRLTLNTKTAEHEQWELPYTNMIRKQNTWTKMRICAIDDFFIFGTSYYQRHVLQCHSFHFWTYNFWQMCIMIPRLHTGPQNPQDTKPILEGIKVQNGLSMIDRPYPLYSQIAKGIWSRIQQSVGIWKGSLCPNLAYTR